MAVEYIQLDQLKTGYTGANVDRPIVAKLMSATVMKYPLSDVWGRHKGVGSCRAGALRTGFDPLFACSEYKVAHAEEKLVPEIVNQWGLFHYMYVDIEPCHSGKYGKNSGGCKLLIHNTFASGKVFYLFDQDNYEMGMNRLVRDIPLQDQAMYLRSMIGVYE